MRLPQNNATEDVRQVDGCVLHGGIWFPQYNLAFDAMKKAATLPNPGRVVAEALVERGKRIWPMPPYQLYVWVRGNMGELVVPRRLPAANWALKRLRGTMMDRMTYPSAASGSFKVELRPYQKRAAEAVMNNPYPESLVVMPCGSGKTTLGLYIALLHPTPTLVLVHTLDLAKQWLARARDQAGIEATLVGGGKKQPPSRITVATVQTLAKWGAAEREAFGSNFGLVITDEAHHTPAPTWNEIMLSLPCKFRLGLTATPERQDGLHPILYWHLGPPLHEVSAEELQAAGATMRAQYMAVRTNYVPPDTEDDSFDWNQLIEDMTTNDERNWFLTRWVQGILDGKRAASVLVLTSRVQHAQDLAHALRMEGMTAQSLVGTDTPRVRAERLEAFRGGFLQVLVATQLADEGLDVPNLGCVLLATPHRLASRIVQQAGRALRPAPGKPTPLFVDMVDRSGPLLGMARKRERVLREYGIIE